jgi:hypothetical protein
MVMTGFKSKKLSSNRGETMLRPGVSIQHWRFEDGKTCPNPGSQWESEPPPRGWYCWVYTNDYGEFIDWMEKTCPTADCTHRFNSGNPMTTVYIKEDHEAVLFQLKWM